MLLDTLEALRARGNTVLVVEHDEATIRRADLVVDLGPGAGHARRPASSPWRRPPRSPAIPASITGRYLGARRAATRPACATLDAAAAPHRARRAPSTTSATSTSRFPLGAWTCVTGVSGSGKSTLVRDVLYAGRAPRASASPPDASARTARHRRRRAPRRAPSRSTRRPIGRTPRSTPASYVGFFDDIRRLFARIARGARCAATTPGRFSFNVAGGRCEACAGQGRHPHGDELPARRLRRLRHLRRPALHRGDARHPLRRPHDRATSWR